LVSVPVIIGIAGEFFRVMLSIVSIVSWAVILWQSLYDAFCDRNNP
jgi:hypothetical protein